MNILVSTLGGTWAIVPELLGLFDPQKLPLYQNHPRRRSLADMVARHGLAPPDEIWLCATGDCPQHTLKAWRDLAGLDLPLRIWYPAGVMDIQDEASAGRMRELIFRCVLHASQQAAGGQLLLSLSGGRKTMSADLQQAAGFFGCHALVHVLSRAIDRKSILGSPVPATLAHPLPAEEAGRLMPLLLEGTPPSELLALDAEGYRPIEAADYPLPHCPDSEAVAVPLPDPDHKWLTAELAERQNKSDRLLGNFLSWLESQESHGNWHSLYQLPPAAIERLRSERLGDQHRGWLQQLPKADLHRHIGGCLHLNDQRRVAEAIWQAATPAQRRKARESVLHLLEDHDTWPWEWPGSLRQNVDAAGRALRAAALLLDATEAQLKRNLYEVTEPRRGLKDRKPHGFAYYERPGELSGSALLGHPAAIEPYMQAIIRNARDEGLAYLELRGSPQKYRADAEGQHALLRQMAEMARRQSDLKIRFIAILDRRHPPDRLDCDVKMAVAAYRELNDFVCGLDLAGDESQDTPEKLETAQKVFRPAFEACMPLTIHAGEGTSADKIWGAAYRLHADRVGHGLTLLEDKQLLGRFRDRGICVELCPTSNEEVIGYTPGTYPFGDYWREGLPLAINTDNPAISRTTLADELLRANVMAESRLSLWDALSLIRQGFRHCFLGAREKRSLLQEMDRRILDNTLTWLEGRGL